MTVDSTAHDTLNAFIARHQRSVWLYLRVLGASESDADDLAQETFLSALRKDQSGAFTRRSDAESASWLRTAARFAWLTRVRKSGRRKEVDFADSVDELFSSTCSEGDASPMLDALESCVASLDEPASTVISRYYTNNDAAAEIAADLNKSEGAFNTMLFRIRQRLKDCVEQKLRHEEA